MKKKKVLVVPLDEFGSYEWRVMRANGTRICDVKLSISSMLNGSHYFILEDGVVQRHGSFNFGVWNKREIKQLLTAIVQTIEPGAEVVVTVPPLQRRASVG